MSETTKSQAPRPQVEAESLSPEVRTTIAKAFGIKTADLQHTLVLVIRKGNGSVPQPCECGCGEQTKGGSWVPGHDSQRKSNLLRVAKGERTAKPNAEFDAMTPEVAVAELTRRGWIKGTTLDKS